LPEPDDLVVHGGTVYTPAGPRQASIHVSGGRIRALDDGQAPAREIGDATGLLVLPGAIDVHVHSRDPGAAEKEDFASLTAAAAVGGVTTVIDMPNTVPGVDGADVFAVKADIAASKALVDFGLWGLIRGGSTPSRIEELAEAGVIGFKAYLGYAWRRSTRQVVQVLDHQEADLDPPPDYGTVAALAPGALRWGLPIVLHAEDPSVLAAAVREAVNYEDILAARPPLAEAVAVAAAGEIARDTGAHLHIAHLSSAAGLAAGRAAIATGARLTMETCPQYLWLSEADADRLGPIIKMYPPVRTAADRDALQQGLATGDIRVVATDHAPHSDQEKIGQTWAGAAAGSPGVQTLLLSCLELAKRMGDVGAAVRWLSENPAALFRLPGKGRIEPGADADLVLVDPRERTLVRSDQMYSRQRHGALEGLEFSFAIRRVYSRGDLVAFGGRPVGTPGRGWLLRPTRPK
jgi:allantoinase